MTTTLNGKSPNGGSAAKVAEQTAPELVVTVEQPTNGTMPTGMFEALDRVRSEVQTGAATKRPVADWNVETEVPQSIDDLPRPGSLRMQWRYLRVLVFAAWLFVRVLFWQLYVRRYFPGWVDRTNVNRWAQYAREYRGFAIALGGVHIKLGQFISTRVDALPEAIIRELESLQDEVPTLPFKQVRQVMQRELGDIDSRYAWFDEKPIAAASLGQAHRAALRNADGTAGERVVVKVQRPYIRRVCYTDLAALKIVAYVAARFEFIRRRTDAMGLVVEFGEGLLQELSYSHEAMNGARFAEMFRDDMGVYIPEIYTAHSTDRVLTIEDVTSIKISDFAALERAGISRYEVAQRLSDTYFKQIFDHFFYHADPHPGNLFIYPLPVEDVQQYIGKGGRPFYLIFIDFGMTGRLTKALADGIVSTITAVVSRDARRLVESYERLGFLLPGADKPRIIEATEAAFNEVWGLSMTEIRDIDYERVTNVAAEFNDLLKALPFYLPQDFIYLGRTVGILSGMCTSLDPAFNPWSVLEPYAQRLALKGFGDGTPSIGGSLVQQTIQNLTSEITRRALPFNPAAQLAEQLRSGEIRVLAEPGIQYKAQLRRLEAQQRRTSRAVVFGAALIVGTLFYTSGDTALALVAYGYCALATMWSFFRG